MVEILIAAVLVLIGAYGIHSGRTALKTGVATYALQWPNNISRGTNPVGFGVCVATYFIHGYAAVAAAAWLLFRIAT